MATLGERLAALEEDEEAPVAARRGVSKRATKNAPMEASSKVRPRRGPPRPANGSTGASRRDPRFEAACGRFKAEHFRQTYAFLESHEQAEIDALEKQGDRARATDLRALRADRKRRDRERRVRADLRQAEAEAIKRGKRPFFPKRSVIKQAVLEDRFRALRKAGKLETFLRRKRAKLRRAGRVVPGNEASA